jgi:hypothetical protein
MNDELSRRTLLIAIGLCVGVLALGAAAAAYFAFHHSSRTMSAANAEAEFLRLRARFAGQRPLLDMTARQAVEPASAPASPATPIRSFHTVIFDTRGRPRLVHMEAPSAFARLFAHRDGRFRWLGELTFLDDTEFDPEPIQLSFEAIRRRGPGLLVDFRHPSGGQFIAWVE